MFLRVSKTLLDFQFLNFDNYESSLEERLTLSLWNFSRPDSPDLSMRSFGFSSSECRFSIYYS
jgi:hypothetical protein